MTPYVLLVSFVGLGSPQGRPVALTVLGVWGGALALGATGAVIGFSFMGHDRVGIEPVTPSKTTSSLRLVGFAAAPTRGGGPWGSPSSSSGSGTCLCLPFHARQIGPNWLLVGRGPDRARHFRLEGGNPPRPPFKTDSCSTRGAPPSDCHRWRAHTGRTGWEDLRRNARSRRPSSSGGRPSPRRGTSR